MSTLKRSVTRGFAAGLAGALVAGAASVLAAVPAQATAPVDVAAIGGTFNWKISDQVVARYGTRVTDGAYETSGGAVAFPIDTASAQGGEVTIEYSGSVDSQFVNRGSVLYSTKIEDPTVTLAADGSGELSAVVSGFQHFEPSFPLERTDPTRVVIGQFDTSSGDLNTTLSATITGFSDSFTGQLASGTSAHFDGTTDAKQPAPFTLEQPSVTAEVDGDVVSVSGSNYFGGDTNYQGIYVGVAESGGLPATGLQTDMDAFAVADWVLANQIVNGSFTHTLEIDRENPDVVVKPGAEYSVYTWQAHRHSTNALDAEFPIGVLTDAVESTTMVTVNRKPAKRQVTVTATVKGNNPTGRVTMALAGGNDKRSRAVALNSNGVARWTFNKLSNVGQYKVDVSYAGDAGNNASEASRNFRMPKVRTNTRVVKLQHAKKARNFKQIRVRARVNNPVPGKTKGQVRIVIKQGKKNVRVVNGVKLNKNGAVNRVVKGLGKQINQKRQYRVVVQYQGTKRYQKSRAVQQFRLN